jgi:hypothetical protein
MSLPFLLPPHRVSSNSWLPRHEFVPASGDPMFRRLDEYQNRLLNAKLDTFFRLRCHFHVLHDWHERRAVLHSLTLLFLLFGRCLLGRDGDIALDYSYLGRASSARPPWPSSARG